MDIHGGNIYKYIREGKKDILDYSSNINPLGVPKKFKELLIDNFHMLEKYPDINYIELREKIAKFNGVNRDNVIVGNGATEILFSYVRALKPKKALLVAPCFAEYERALNSIGCEIEFFKLSENGSYTLNIDRLFEKLSISSYDLLLICNPNNPTGNLINKDDIFKIIKFVESSNINFFIDEAFIEFIDEWKNKTAILFKSKNLFVMRAYTKFFAIPGLRLGYGITFNEELINKIYLEKEPWSVNSFANLAGIVMLDDEEYISESEKWIKEEKNWFYNELIKLKNIKVFKSEVNFILIKLLNLSAKECQNRMLDMDILIRDASNFHYLDNSYIRVAIKSRQNNLKFLQAFKNVVEWRG